nr:unnamed protein product [Spirometra erinaceieuropaei]
MIFAAHQLQEKCQGMQTHVYSSFVDLTTAFDMGNRDVPRRIMQNFRCRKRFTQMARQLHDGTMARVTDNGTVSQTFEMTHGVTQGCVLAPTLLSLMFSGMLMDAYRDESPRIRITYRMDGRLLNHRRMHFWSRTSTTTVHELRFADDCVPNATTEEDMHRSTNGLVAVYSNFGLFINMEKTVVMHQPAANGSAWPTEEISLETDRPGGGL